jgi:hypothetical protein
MSKNTALGKSFDVNELIKLTTIGALNADQHKGALLGALRELKGFHVETPKLRDEVKRLQALLNNHLGEQYRADLRRERGE